MIIEPAEGIVLVELSPSNHGSVPMTEKYDSVMSGVIIAVNSLDKNEDKIGKTEYHRQFKDDCRPAKNQALIEIKDILGYGTPDTKS